MARAVNGISALCVDHVLVENTISAVQCDDDGYVHWVDGQFVQIDL